MELLTLDKEVAEERVEFLQQELTEKTLRIEELEVEMALLKTEMETETAQDGDMTVSRHRFILLAYCSLLIFFRF